jgi:hypothetical protein
MTDIDDLREQQAASRKRLEEKQAAARKRLEKKQAAEIEAFERRSKVAEMLTGTGIDAPDFVHKYPLYGVEGTIDWKDKTVAQARAIYERFPGSLQQVVRKGWVTVSPAGYDHGEGSSVVADLETPVLGIDPNWYSNTYAMKWLWNDGMQLWTIKVGLPSNLNLYRLNMRKVEFLGRYRWERTGYGRSIGWTGPHSGEEMIIYASGSAETLPTAIVYWPLGTLDAEGVFDMLEGKR